MSSLSVVIGVLTFRRQEHLRSLLPLLIDQVDRLPASIRAEILVIDNDPDASAESAVRDQHPLVRYVHEPVPGIATARQRCLDEAYGADLLQFIDDDEEPVDDWLGTMINAWRSYDQPAGVAGRVIPRFAVPPSDWIIAGGFFERPRFASGTLLPAAPAGNLLLDLNQIRAFGTSFDRTLGLSGGEDTLFTKQVVTAGGRIVFCDEAAVTDLVPAERSTRSWVLQRAWFHGNVAAQTRLRLCSDGREWITRCRLVVGGALRAAWGLMRVASSTLRGNTKTNTLGWKFVHRGLGMAAGGLGRTQPEYAREAKIS